MSTTYLPFNIYVVATDSDNPNHHGLHTNTAPHLLTANPNDGDRIVAVLRGRQEIEIAEDGSWTRLFVEVTARGAVDRHAGRSALLGEDGLEDAFGGDALSDLVPEILAGASWRYAPCAYTADPDGPRCRYTWTRRGPGDWTAERDSYAGRSPIRVTP